VTPVPSRPLVLSSLALLLAAGPLIACVPQQPTQPTTTVTAAQYATFQRAMANPKARAAYTARCLDDAKAFTADDKGAMSAMLDVEVADVPQVFCERFLAAVGRGDISYPDFAAMQAHTHDAQVMRRLLRALREPADEQKV
jgi:hypothetical protein